MPHGPLNGVRVLELSQIVGGPFAGIILSDLGADVIKLEPPTGDPFRNAGAVVPMEGKRFQSLNRGKRSLVVDLQTTQGQAVVHRLVRFFDLLVVNYRPGVANRLRVDYQTLSALHPPLIYCEITGFGSKGPLADRPASDIIALAYSGLMAGDEKIDEDGAPQHITPSIADYTCGLSAVVGICSALYHRALSGQGQLIQTSLLRGALAIQDTSVMREPVSDAVLRDAMLQEVNQAWSDGAGYEEILEIRKRHRFAGASFHRCYYGSYQTKDRPIVLGCVTPATLERARQVIGILDDPSEQPGFSAHSQEGHDLTAELKARIARIMRTKTCAEWLAAFEANGVPVSPVNLPEEMADDPQVLATGLMVGLEHAVTGPQRVAGPIVEMSRTPIKAVRAAPFLGAHTDEILLQSEFTRTEIAELRELGVIG